ncbi:MFS transporter, partial [Streptomyces sp. NPDC048279]
VSAGSPVWLLLAVGALLGVPQGLLGLAAQTALYRQADPERIGSAAGLLRTFMYLGALGASAATAAFYPHRADTGGLHGLALFMLAGSVLLLAITLPDRSLARLTPRLPQAPRKA